MVEVREPSDQVFNEEEKWLFVERGLVSIVANLDDVPHRVPLRDGRPTHLWLVTHDEGIELQGDVSILLPGNSLAILGPVGEDTAQAMFRSSVEVLSI